MSESSDYTSYKIIARCDDVKDLKMFYQEDFLDYKGLALDNKERYTEIIAGWIIKNREKFKQIEPIHRESSYCTNGHDGKNNPASNSERNIAKRFFQQGKKERIPGIGLILDYETPLCNIRSDEVGKIDLLAFDREKNVLRILELKHPDSEDTMLHCVMEAYTYLRLVDREKLIRDFNSAKSLSISLDTPIIACPLIFRRNSKGENGAQYQEMQEDRPKLKKLMELLEIKPIIIEENKAPYSSYELEL